MNIAENIPTKGNVVATTNRTHHAVSNAAVHRDGSSKETSRRLYVIFMRKIGDNGVKADFEPIRVDEILYFFTAGALSSTRTVIDATGREPKFWESKVFFPGRVYGRTAKGIFVTASRFRTVSQILQWLDPDKFVTIQKSLAVNVLKISRPVFDAKLKQVGVVADGVIEWLTVSRRSLRNLRVALGM